MLDATDKKILNLLLKNAKLSYRQIAKKIAVSAATIMYRVKRLEQQGVIQRYTAQLDYERLGYDLAAAIEVRILRGKLFEVERLLARDHRVQAVYDVTGAFDALVIGKFKNRRDLDRFVKKVQTYEFIERTETKLVLNTIKEESLEVL